jgi:hypothetical protein
MEWRCGMLLRRNKGEWFEMLCLFDLLQGRSVRTLSGASRYEVEWVERLDGRERERRRYYPLSSRSTVLVENLVSGKVRECLIPDFDDRIMAAQKEVWQGEGRSFESPLSEDLMERLGIEKVKASSANKDDLTVKFRGMAPAGYSAKAEGCGAPSLLNAGRNTTRIRFRVRLDGDAHEGKRGKKLFSSFEEIMADEVLCKTFRENMGTDATRMVAAAAGCYLRSPGVGSVESIVEDLGGRKFLGYDLNGWRRWMKGFLYMCAVEGTPGTPIGRDAKASGGIVFIFPEKAARVLTFRDSDDLKTYLYENSTFDSPDIGRHEWGTLYFKGGRHYADYVLGIRLRSHTVGVGE